MADPVAISVNDVSKMFGHGRDAFYALDQVSVDIRENEFFTLLGRGNQVVHRHLD